MKVTGSAVLHASREQVWQALTDPAVLVRTIPGCLRLEATAPDAYAMTVTAGVGTIKGVYAGDVRLHDQHAPGSFVLSASGAGAPGTVSCDVAVTLSEDGDAATQVAYSADAVVGGMIGGVGQRMLAVVATKTAREFFAAVDDVLAGREAVPAAASTTAASTTGRDAGVVYTAPPPALPRGALLTGEFTRGVLVGAAIALAGAVVGGWAAGRQRR